MRIQKEMTQETVEYASLNKEVTMIEKFNIRKDGTQKNKTIDLKKSKINGRYFSNAGKLFEYLVFKKGYVVIN